MEMHFSQNNSPSYRLIELDEVDSTNSYLRRLDVQGDQRPVLVTAEFQSAGRGADTNRWESERGKNLLFSLRLMPKSLPARRMFALSETAALAVMEAMTSSLPQPLQRRGGRMRQFTPPLEGKGEATIKWPNDIYYGDSKVAGILIENDLQGPLVQHSTIGIGINVNQRRFLSDAPNPRSLADIVGHDVERRFVLERFMESFTRYFRQIEGGNMEALDALHETYKSHLYRLGEEHSYSDKDGTFRATLFDVEPSGHLVLCDKEGKHRRYAFKEVKFSL